MILTSGMAHPRKLIRKAVVALLLAANTAAATRVKPTRVEPHKKSQLPAIGVYTLNDPVDDDESSETEEAHELELEVVGWVAHSDDYTADDAMDDLAEQIENAMKADPYFGTEAENSSLVGTVMQVVEDDARSDPNVGIIVLTYAVKYRSSLTAAAPVADFLTVESKQKLQGGVADTPIATDLFTVQEIAP